MNRSKVIWAAAVLALPTMASAQENATNVDMNVGVENNALADPSLDAADGFNTTDAANDTIANDLALANTVEPEREDDNDFPWGLLGLLGLAGLLGRKKADDIHVDARTRRDV